MPLTEEESKFVEKLLRRTESNARQWKLWGCWVLLVMAVAMTVAGLWLITYDFDSQLQSMKRELFQPKVPTTASTDYVDKAVTWEAMSVKLRCWQMIMGMFSSLMAGSLFGVVTVKWINGRRDVIVVKLIREYLSEKRA